MLTPLQLWRLKRFCDKYEIDYQEIDNTLTEWENKEHLASLVFGPLIADLDQWEAQMEWYLAHYFLEYYIACIEAGWTISSEMGEIPPHYPRFSLETYIQQTG